MAIGKSGVTDKMNKLSIKFGDIKCGIKKENFIIIMRSETARII